MTRTPADPPADARPTPPSARTGGPQMQVCALTGGIASGKSTVADMLESEQLPVIRADRLAAEVIAPNTPGWAQVVAQFGRSIVAPDGTLDRPALGAQVFADAAKRRALEAIVHPLVQASFLQQKAELARDGARCLLYEIPLLLETGRQAEFDLILTVVAPMEQRLAWLEKRNGLQRHEAQARIRAQTHDHARILAADLVVHNDGERSELLRQAPALLQALHQRLQFKRKLRFGS